MQTCAQQHPHTRTQARARAHARARTHTATNNLTGVGVVDHTHTDAHSSGIALDKSSKNLSSTQLLVTYTGICIAQTLNPEVSLNALCPPINTPNRQQLLNPERCHLQPAGSTTLKQLRRG